MRGQIAALGIALVTFGASLADAMECRDDPAVVASCFAVRGRLSINSRGEIQVWPVGTNRLLQLGYPPDSARALTGWPYMPSRFETLLRAGEAELWGNFEVCPLTYDIPGQRRMICIQSGTQVRVVDNPRYGEFAKARRDRDESDGAPAEGEERATPTPAPSPPSVE